jgi:hypothetical protein
MLGGRSGAPKSPARAPGGGGEDGKAYRRLGREEGRPEEEIYAGRRSSGDLLGAAALCVWGREEKWRGVKRRPCSAFYRTTEGKGRRRGGGGVKLGRPTISGGGGRLGGGRYREGEGEQGGEWAAE